jgi:hypothetical protein
MPGLRTAFLPGPSRPRGHTTTKLDDVDDEERTARASFLLKCRQRFRAGQKRLAGLGPRENPQSTDLRLRTSISNENETRARGGGILVNAAGVVGLTEAQRSIPVVGRTLGQVSS